MPSKFLKLGDDQVYRCAWCGDDPLYINYHDDEWGVPQKDDRRMFEKICLEGFQAGLSWLTILRKRKNFRLAFDHFDIASVGGYSRKRIDLLLRDASIIRHRGKIEAAVNNAQRAAEMIGEWGSLGSFFWGFEPQPRKSNTPRSLSEESVAMSKQLKRLGWKFVGPTTCYSFMQSLGIVNDHHRRCSRWEAVERLRENFRRPQN